MNVQGHYEKYWKKKSQGKFWDYERNWVLPLLFQSGEKVLDLACGQGVVAEYLTTLGVNVFGIDISKKAVIETKKKGISAVVADVETGIPFSNGRFDSVFWGDNVEHLFNPEAVLKEIHRVLKKSGRVIISFPNMAYLRYRIYYLLQGRIPDTEWSGNAPWLWNHIRFFDISIVKDFLEQGGFRLKKVIGINRRFPERFIVNLNPPLLGMILVIEAQKI